MQVIYSVLFMVRATFGAKRNHIINAWNSLSDYVVTSPTVACFKHKLANFNFTL